MNDYIQKALRTKSNMFMMQPGGQNIIVAALMEATDVTKRLVDPIKKMIFYNKVNEKSEAAIEELLIRVPESVLSQKNRTMLDMCSEDIGMDVIHGTLGALTEAGEMAECLFEGTFDRDTFVEEAGDLLWYLAILFNALDTSFEEVMAENIDKLQRRFPEKFDEDLAKNRD